MIAKHASSLSSWVRTIKFTLDRQGIDTAALFEQAGLDVAALQDPNARYSLASSTRLWALAREATGDDAIGLKVAGNINHTTFHALGYALLASPTLMDAFERLLRYFRIVTDAAELEFRSRETEHQFVIHPLPGELQPADEAVDAMMLVIMRMCYLLYGRGFAAREISFRRPAPTAIAAFENAFRVPLAFAEQETTITLDNEVLTQPLPSANRELARHNEAILVRYLAEFEKDNIANGVHALLVEQLPFGEPQQAEIAKSLNLSPRNMQRKLKAEDTSYNQILDATRQALARRYLEESHYSVSEITYLLGFSGSSSFTRAFRRWTGQAPSAYRSEILHGTN